MLKPFLKMSSAGLISQGIAFLSSIYLTRLYAPEEFATYVLYISLITMIQGAVTGKFELAFLTAKRDKESVALFILSVVFVFVSLIIGVFILGLSTLLLDETSVIFYLITLLSIILFGFNNILLFYFNKSYSYDVISSCKVIQTVVFSSLAIILGHSKHLELGMIYAYMISLLGTLTIFLSLFKFNFFDRANNISFIYLIAVAKRNKDFFKYNATTTVLNGALNNLPVLLMNVFSYSTLMGLYGFVVKLVGAPVNFLSSAISQIHMRKLVEIIHQNKKMTKYLMVSYLLILAFGMSINIVIFFSSDFFITTFFDERWLETIWIIKAMSFTILFKFSVVSISGTLSTLKKNKLLAAWKIYSFSIGIILLPILLIFLSSEFFIYSVAFFEAIIYLSLLFFVFKSSMEYDKGVFDNA